MNPRVLGALVGLARVDQLRRETSDRLATVPGRRARIDDLEERLQADLASVEQGREDTEKERRAREQEIVALDERIGKDAAALNAIRNNTEYQAVVKQIAETKTRKTALENQVLELMEREEELGRRMKSERERAARELESLAGERQALREEEERLKLGLADRDGERERLIDELDPEVRARYRRVAGAKHGIAVVAVVKGACGGCFASLPPQRVNEVRLGQQLVLCDACSRILVWNEETASK